MISFLGYALAALICAEVAFRVWYKLKTGHGYHVSIKFPWDRSHVVAHPFLSFAYKRNGSIDINQPLPYELHYHKFFSFKKPLRLNNYGHFGPDFHREKAPGTLRVACIGASTTANNISDGERDYSYPELLQGMLQEHFDRQGLGLRAEVFNCGIGGWSSADILVNYLLNIAALRPDYILVYHGFNDLHLHLMRDFTPDYQAGRRNLGEVLHLIRRAYLLPKIPFWHLYEFAKDRLLGTGNIRNDLLALISKQELDFGHGFETLSHQQDNLRHLLLAARHHGARAILSSFAMYQYHDDVVTKKLYEGVSLENLHLRQLAQEFDAPFVDQANLIPLGPECFVDAIHFTPEGMRVLARNFCDELVRDLQARGDTAVASHRDAFSGRDQ